MVGTVRVEPIITVERTAMSFMLIVEPVSVDIFNIGTCRVVPIFAEDKDEIVVVRSELAMID